MSASIFGSCAAARMIALGLLLLATAACEKRDGDVVRVQSPVQIDRQALDEKVESAKAKLSERQRAFSEQSQRQLNALDERIASLKARAAAGTEQARHKADEALSELARQREEARAALERAQNASEQQWDALKGGAAQALTRAERAYNDALQKLKTD
jgi:hypothetical protein